MLSLNKTLRHPSSVNNLQVYNPTNHDGVNLSKSQSLNMRQCKSRSMSPKRSACSSRCDVSNVRKHAVVSVPADGNRWSNVVESSRVKSGTLCINVGGEAYTLSRATYTKSHAVRCTRLGAMCSTDEHEERVALCTEYWPDTNEYYFERTSIWFEPVLEWYITGDASGSPSWCQVRWDDELKYWRIPVQCCDQDDIVDDELVGPLNITALTSIQAAAYLLRDTRNDPFESALCLRHFRRSLYETFDNPKWSSMANVVSLVSCAFVMISVLGLILASMPSLADILWLFDALETACIVWFTIEFVVKFICVPTKCAFMRQPMNVIDILCIVPFYLDLIMHFSAMEQDLSTFVGLLLVMRILRVCRVLRVFKLARYSGSLQSFGKTMTQSLGEVGLLMVFVAFGVIFFSTIVYFFEHDEPNSKFVSIPTSAWWCVNTMATVGYGDMVPKTTGGKLTATVASIFGIIALAFPISMLVDKFSKQVKVDDPRLNAGGKRSTALVDNYRSFRNLLRQSMSQNQTHVMSPPLTIHIEHTSTSDTL